MDKKNKNRHPPKQRLACSQISQKVWNLNLITSEHHFSLSLFFTLIHISSLGHERIDYRNIWRDPLIPFHFKGVIGKRSIQYTKYGE